MDAQIHATNKAPLVVWLDDDLFVNRYQIRTLEQQGIEVKQFASPDEAIDYIRQTEVDLVVTDILLPTGELFFGSVEAEGGLRTGLLFARLVRKIRPKLKLLAYTISRSPEVEDWFSNQRNCWFALKMEYPGRAVCALVLSILNDKPFRRSARFLRFFEAVDLKPGLFGISVDLKKLGSAALRALRRN